MAQRSTSQFSEMRREHKSFLASAELKLLTFIALKLPDYVTPDKLSALGVIGAAMTAGACVASVMNIDMMYVAILGLMINWFGDSLDGTLARVRSIERPSYGFYIDLCSDLVSHSMIMFGLGLSSLMHLSTALMALLGSVFLQFYDLLQLPVSRVHRVSYFGLGFTEIRILISCGLMVVLLSGQRWVFLFNTMTIFDIGGVLVFVVSVIGVVSAFRRDRLKFARLDSAPFPASIAVRRPATVSRDPMDFFQADRKRAG